MDTSGSPTKETRERAWRIAPLDFAWLLSPLLYPLLRWSTQFLPGEVRAPLAFLLVVLLPGWLLHLLIMPRARIGLAARITRAFALGLAAVAFLGLLVWFAGGDLGLGPVQAERMPLAPFAGHLSTLVWSQPVFLFLLAVGQLWRNVRRRRRAARPVTVAEAERADSAAAGRVAAVGRSDDQQSAAAATRSGPAPEPDAERDDRSARPRPSPLNRIVREAYRLGDQHKADHPVAPRWATLLVLGVIVLTAAALGFYAGGDYGFSRDSLAHTACVREMLEQDRVLPRTSFYADGDGASVDGRMGFFHVALAMVCQLASVGAPQLWLLLPGILAPFGLIIFHTLARRLLRTEGTALFATFLALILFGEAESGLLTRFAYGNQMGMVLAWATLATALHYALNDRRRALLYLIAVSGFAAAATHVFAAVQILFTLGVFSLALLIFRGPRQATFRRTALAILAVSAGALPLLLWRYVWAYAPLNPVHLHRHGLLYLSESLYVIMPDHWARHLMGVGFGGIFLSLFLWRRARASDRVLYLTSLSVAPLLIVANPLATVVLEPRLGYLVARFIVATPFLMVFAYMARRMGESLLELNSTRRVVTSLLFYAFMLWLLFPRLEAFARSYAPEKMARLESQSALIWQDLLDGLDREIPDPAVVLSDPFTAYSIPALTHHHTVAVLHQHASPSDSLAIDRLAACRDVLSPYLGTGEKARICRRFGVDYVLVNGLIPERWHSFFADAGPHLVAEQVAALSEDRDLFAPIWDLEDRGAALFRVRREHLDALSGIVQPGGDELFRRTTAEVAREVLRRELPGDAVAVFADTVAGVTLAAARFDTRLIAREEWTTVTLYWRRVGPAPEFPLINYVRLDTEPPRSPLWMTRLSKVHRHFVHAQRGERFRLQVQRAPLRGMFGVEHWPRDCFVADPLRLRLPETAVSGEYFVQVKWLEQSLLPNLPIEHFLTDRDAYEGAVAGVLEVY